MLGCTRDLEHACLGDRAREIRTWLQEERNQAMHTAPAAAAKGAGASSRVPESPWDSGQIGDGPEGGQRQHQGSRSHESSIWAAMASLWRRFKTTGGASDHNQLCDRGSSEQGGTTGASSVGQCDDVRHPLPNNGPIARPPPSAWVAIDDMDLAAMEPEFMEGHFVRTSMEHGLTDAHAAKAIEILMAVGSEDI